LVRIFLSLAGLGHAADPDHSSATLLDLDLDGNISYEQFVGATAAKAIRDLDIDKDGSLSRDEVKSSSGKSSAVTINFSEADQNGDGKIDQDELGQALAKHDKMQMQSAPPPPPNANVAGGAQLFIYPRQGQSAEQQARDRNECHAWVAKQLGAESAQSAGQTPDYSRALDACLDARGYTVR
jgi:Ca2+-binding EF-hand superfamily protein